MGVRNRRRAFGATTFTNGRQSCGKELHGLHVWDVSPRERRVVLRVPAHGHSRGMAKEVQLGLSESLKLRRETKGCRSGEAKWLGQAQRAARRTG